MNPRISVIIPVYNCEKYLDDCLKSLLGQSCSDFELLLIDDGSKDASAERCDYYAGLDNRVRVFHKANGGVSSARNLGIEKAAGEWLLFVDSDDYVSQTFIGDAVVQLSKVSDDASVVFQGYNRFENGACSAMALEERYFSVQQKGEAVKYLHIERDALGYVCSKMMNLSLIRKYQIRFDEKVALSEDMLFTLEYLKRCNHVYITPLCNYYYRIDSAGSLSKRRIDYLKGKHVIERTNQLLGEIIDNPAIFSLFEPAYLRSSFSLLLNLFSSTNAGYDRAFRVREVNGYKERKNIQQVKFSSKSYVLLYWVVFNLPTAWVCFIYKLYFKLKALKTRN